MDGVSVQVWRKGETERAPAKRRIADDQVKEPGRQRHLFKTALDMAD